MQPATTRILIADDHCILCSGLRRLLEAEIGMTVVGEATDGQSAVEMAEKLSPDVIVMDINMPGVNGIEATRRIMANPELGKSTKIIALSAYSEPRFVSQMFQAGALGYILKNSVFSELSTAMKAVMEGKEFLSPSLEAFRERSEPADVNPTASGTPDVGLSPREKEILRLLSDGCSMKEIARQLQISIKTVETHRRNFIAKLELDSIASLTKYAIRQGITTLDA